MVDVGADRVRDGHVGVAVAVGVAGRGRLYAWGLVIGPAAFVMAWAVGGAGMPSGYSPAHDAISRIAAVHSPERTLMTAGFVVYAAAVGLGSLAVRRSVLWAAWPAVAVNAVATLAVASLPLDHSTTVDHLHAAAATVGYASISLAPLLAAPALRRLGRPGVAAASMVLGTVSTACLVATIWSAHTGLFQRLGLTTGDVWLIATGVALARERSSGPRR